MGIALVAIDFFILTHIATQQPLAHDAGNRQWRLQHAQMQPPHFQPAHRVFIGCPGKAGQPGQQLTAAFVQTLQISGHGLHGCQRQEQGPQALAQPHQRRPPQRGIQPLRRDGRPGQPPARGNIAGLQAQLAHGLLQRGAQHQPVGHATRMFLGHAKRIPGVTNQLLAR